MKKITIGTDIEEVSRFENVSDRFIHRCFHQSEIDYCLRHKNSAQNFCGRFCAKEALAKAVGHAGNWLDAEIVNNESGKPEIILHGKLAEELKNAQIDLSVSHCSKYATAVVIVVYE